MDRQPRTGQRHRSLGGSSTYGGSPANPGLSATGLQNGQNVGVLSGLSNSFGIGSASNAGDYTLSVAGSLTNTNYVVTGTNTGTWTVNPAPVSVTGLRGSLTDGSSPSIPGQSVTAPPNTGSSSVLNGLGNSSNGVNTGNAGGDRAGIAGSPTKPASSAVGPSAGIPTVNPLPVSPDAPVAVPFTDQTPYMAATEYPSAKACPGEEFGGSADAVRRTFAYATGTSSDRQARPCAAAAPKKPSRLIDFALSKLNRSARSSKHWTRNFAKYEIRKSNTARSAGSNYWPAPALRSPPDSWAGFCAEARCSARYYPPYRSGADSIL